MLSKGQCCMMQPQASDEGVCVYVGEDLCLCGCRCVCACVGGSGCWTSATSHNNELQKEG